MSLEMESTSELRAFVLIITVAATFTNCGALRMEGYFDSDFETQMEYVGRFIFNPDTHGRMLYDVKFPVNECCVTMVMFRGDESQWPQVRAHEDEMTCFEKYHTVPGIQNSKIFFNLGERGCFLDTDDNGDEIVHCISSKNMFVSKFDRWFYITFMNCHYKRNVGVHVEYKIQVFNGNDTLSREFSADESSNLAVTFISAVVLTTLIICAIIQTVQLSHQRKLHTTYRVWLLSVFTQYIGVIITLVALFNFALDGYKRDASIMAAHILTSVGNVIFTVILILIGKGYTITRLTIRTVGVLKIWLFVCTYSAMFISLYILKEFADSRDVRNIYDSPAAVGLVILRFIALGWVFYGVYFTIKDYPKKRIFYSAFILFITAWFLSEPVMILMSKYFIPLYCRAKVIDALYLGTAIFGHVVFLCLTRPSTTNRFFPFHLSTNKVDSLSYEYVSDPESPRFEGFYDIFMADSEKAKKISNQDRVPTISSIVSEKDTVSACETCLEPMDSFPSAEKENTTGTFEAGKTLGRKSIYQHIEPEEERGTTPIQAAKDNTSSHLESEKDNATDSVQAATTMTQSQQHFTTAFLQLEKEIFTTPAQEIASVRDPQRMYPSSESESDEDLGLITLDDVCDKMAEKNRLPDVEKTTSTKGVRNSTTGIHQLFPLPLHTTILTNEAALVYNSRDPIQTNTKNGEPARKPSRRAEDAQKMSTSASVVPPDTAVKSCTSEDPVLQTEQTTPVVRNKEHRATSTYQREQDKNTKNEEMVDQPPPIPKKKKHQLPSSDEYKQNEAVSSPSNGVLKEKAIDNKEKIKALRAALRQAEAEYEMDQLLKEGASSVDEEEKRQRRRNIQQGNSSFEEDASEETEGGRRRRMRAGEVNEEKKIENMFHQDGITPEYADKEERRRRRRAAKMLEKRQASEMYHQEDTSPAEIERNGRTNARASPVGHRTSEVQHQAGVYLADLEKEERRRRRRAAKMLEEKTHASGMCRQEDTASAEVERNDRRKAWESPEGHRTSEMQIQGGESLANADKEERRRRRRAARMLEKRQTSENHHEEHEQKEEIRKAWEAQEGNRSPEVLHQEGETSCEVEKEERRRRRRVKKMLEKRQSSELVHEEDTASEDVERGERRKRAWQTSLEENKSPEKLFQEGDMEKERKKSHAKKMLEKKRSSEVLQQDDAASAEAEREERRRRRCLRKNLEARRQAELEAQIV